MKKNQKKGFTLVELLVVIVILTALILLALPTVLNVMETNNKNIFANQLVKFASTAQEAYMQFKVEDGAAVPTCYIIDEFKDGDSFEGCIVIDYATDKISAINAYNYEFSYIGTLLDLTTEKGKVVDKLPGGGAYSSFQSSIYIAGGATTLCPATCIDPVDRLANP